MKGCRCSWAAGRCGQREARGCTAAWHTMAVEEKGKRGSGGQLSARGRRKEGGPTARCRVEEESVGGPSVRQGAWPAGVVAGQASAMQSRRAGGARELRVRAWAGRGKGGSWAEPERNSVNFDLK
jgi:hypothetical protein